MKPTTLIFGGLTILLCLVNFGDGSGFLLPLATITSHAGLYASSFTSAALMKLRAAAAIAALAGITQSGFHFRIGNGPPIPDLPHHHGGGWHRRRRSTHDETEAPQVDASLDEVLSYDQLGCGMRLVCELAATPETELANDGKLILELFGRDGKAPNPEKSSRGKLSYSYASLLGENAKDASACSRVYARCPYSGQDILESLRAANV